MLIPFGVFSAAGAGGGAAAGSYELISTTILGSSTSSVTFSSVPTTYKHLQLRIHARSAAASDNNIFIQFNADTAANYRTHHLYGNGAAVESFDNGAGSAIYVWSFADSTDTAGIFSPFIVDILDSSSSAKFKTTRGLFGTLGASKQVGLSSGLWRNTAAITQVKINHGTMTQSFAAGSRFSLYGIVG